MHQPAESTDATPIASRRTRAQSISASMDGPSATPLSLSAYSTFGGTLGVDRSGDDAVLLQLLELLDRHLLVHAFDPLLQLREP
ncbi:hypothetical protein ASF32_09815 [Methylobacterium sp. Leaf91]|nr:hypothetical protein ASF32_09815 [Methylobacterium sp. Leaf91]